MQGCPLKRLIFIISILYFFGDAYGQENFISGYVVTDKGDSINGWLDYRAWESNPGRISFKRELSGEKEEFNPQNCKRFGALGKIEYVSAKIEIEIGANAQLEFKTEEVFLKTIIRGTKSLYQFKDKDGRDRFYISGYTSFELLLFKKYNSMMEGREMIVENKKFIGQLTVYLRDCSTIHSALEHIPYKSDQLEKVFLSYYDYTKSHITFRSSAIKAKSYMGALLGYSFTSVSSYKTSANPVFGAYFNLVLPGKVSVYNELAYTSFDTEGTYHESANINNFTDTYEKIGFSAIKLNNMIRYRFSSSYNFFFLNAGISSGYYFEQTNYQKTVANVYGTITTVEGKAVDPVKNFEIGVNFGFGVNIQSFSFEIRFESSNGFAAISAFNSRVYRDYLILGYRIR